MIPTNLRNYRYQPVYQDLPLDTIGKVFEKKEANFEENQDNFIKFANFFNSIKTNPHGRKYLDSKLEQYKKDIESLGTNLQGNKKWDDANSIISRMAYDFGTDAKIGTLMENQKRFEQAETIKAQLNAKGETPIELGDDYHTFENFDQDGNVKLYNPVVQPKGDYVKELGEMWKNFKPTLIESGLQPSQIAGYLQNETLATNIPQIRKATDDVTNLFKTSSSGQQFINKLKRDNPNISEQDINDRIKHLTRAVGSMYEQQSSKTNYVPDQNYLIEQKAQNNYDLEKLKQQNRIQLKSIRKSANVTVDDEGKEVKLFDRQAGTYSRDGKTIQQNSVINNATLMRSLKESYLGNQIPNPNNFKNLTNDKSSEEIVKEGIQDITPVGFNVINSTNDEQYKGAMLATIKTKEGSYNTMINIGSKNPILENIKTINNINNETRKDRKGTKKIHLADDSNLIRYHDKDGNPLNVRTGFEIETLNDNNWSGSPFIIRPIIYDTENKPLYLNKQQIRQSFMKETYTMDDLYDETNRLLTAKLLPALYNHNDIVK